MWTHPNPNPHYLPTRPDRKLHSALPLLQAGKRLADVDALRPPFVPGNLLPVNKPQRHLVRVESLVQLEAPPLAVAKGLLRGLLRLFARSLSGGWCFLLPS